MPQQSYTAASTITSFYSVYDLTHINDGSYASGTMWLTSGVDFEMSMTFDAAVALDSLVLQGGQFNGSFNEPVQIKIYRGDSSTGTLLATITPTYSADTYSFTNTTFDTLYTLVISPDPSVGACSIIEIEAYGASIPSYEGEIRGVADVFNAAGGEARGSYRVGFDSYDGTARGQIAVLNSLSGCTRGRTLAFNSFQRNDRGQFAVLSLVVMGAMRGKDVHRNVFIAAARTVYRVLLAIAGTARGNHRIANAASDRYELYRGVNAAADLAGAPWETFTSLPHSTAALTPPGSGTTAYHLVLRKRNQWGLISLNGEETVITISADGSVPAVGPSSPTQTTAVAAAAGKVSITSRYPYTLDGSLQAGVWLLYLTTDGSDPNPGSSPIVLAMSKADGVAKLNYLTAAQPEGTVVKALVRVRRAGSPNVDSVNVLTVSAIATLLGPAGNVTGGIFLGSSEQVQ